MLLARHLRRHRATWLSGRRGAGDWCSPPVPWPSALRPCCSPTIADLATELFGWLRDALAVPARCCSTPAGFALCACGRRGAGSSSAEGSGIPQAMAAAALARPGASRAAAGRPGARCGKVALTIDGAGGRRLDRPRGPDGPGRGRDHAGGGQLRRHRPGRAGWCSPGPPPGWPRRSTPRWPGSCSRSRRWPRNSSSGSAARSSAPVVLAGITGLALVGDYRYFGQTSAQLDSAAGLAGRAAVRDRRRRLLGGLFSLGRGRPWPRARHGLVAGVARRRTGLVRGWLRPRRGGAGRCSPMAMPTAPPTAGARTAGVRHDAAVVAAPLKLPQRRCCPRSAASRAACSHRHCRSAPGWGRLLPTSFCRSLDLRALSLLAMVAYFAGVVQAPLTAFVIVLEMSEGSRMVVPLDGDGVAGDGSLAIDLPASASTTCCRADTPCAGISPASGRAGHVDVRRRSPGFGSKRGPAHGNCARTA